MLLLRAILSIYSRKFTKRFDKFISNYAWFFFSYQRGPRRKGPLNTPLRVVHKLVIMCVAMHKRLFIFHSQDGSSDMNWVQSSPIASSLTASFAHSYYLPSSRRDTCTAAVSARYVCFIGDSWYTIVRHRSNIPRTTVASQRDTPIHTDRTIMSSPIY